MMQIVLRNMKGGEVVRSDGDGLNPIRDTNILGQDMSLMS